MQKSTIIDIQEQQECVLITGSRDWNDYNVVKEELDLLKKDSILVHGGCRGADVMAGHYWKKLGGKVLEEPADWKKFGTKAGPIRNALMLEKYPITSAIAFRKGVSVGTAHMVSLLKSKHIPVVERWV